MRAWNTAWNTRRAGLGTPKMLNDYVGAQGLKTAVGILSLLRMPFRQGAACLVFQVVFQLFWETPSGLRRIIGQRKLAMHSHTHGAYTFICDGDALTSPDSRVEIVGPAGERTALPAGVLVAFVAGLVASERIAEIEQLEPLQVLGVAP